MSRSNSHDMKAARRRARTAGTCPGCGSEATPGPLPGGREAPAGRVMAHQEGCALTAALAAVSGEHGADARFFEAHPGVRSYTRPVMPAELVEQALGWPHYPPVSRSARVLVTRLGPALRARVVYSVSRLN
jgi:hypothetical protein